MEIDELIHFLFFSLNYFPPCQVKWSATGTNKGYGLLYMGLSDMVQEKLEPLTNSLGLHREYRC